MKFTSASSQLSSLLLSIFSQYSYSQIQSWLDLDTVKAGRFDTGKMWTFEYPPTDYFEEEYGFTPDKELV